MLLLYRTSIKYAQGFSEFCVNYTTYAVALFACGSMVLFWSIVFGFFALAERKKPNTKKMKYRSAEGRNCPKRGPPRNLCKL
jgi:hypothetical protein